VLDAFVLGLRELGYIEGRDYVIEARWAEGKLDRLPALVDDLLKQRLDLIFAPSGIAALAVKKSGTSLPIVFALAPDPVGQGFAASLARPGGNMTGLTSTHTELAAKRVEILRETFPAIRRVALLYFVAGAPAGVAEQVAEIERAATMLGLIVIKEESPGPDDFDRAFASVKRQQADALIVIENPVYFNSRARLVDQAAGLRIPAIYNVPEYVRAGGLMCYGASYDDLCRRAAGYAVKIRKGAAPGALPVERPIKLELAVNMKAARAAGLSIPTPILLRATEVIE
jgi:putative ABC transport system substrate-binding protein